MALAPLNIEHPSISREKRASPARYDPLEILPEEIWTSIIVETALDMEPKGELGPYEDTEPTISQNSLLHLTRVSCAWETKITSNPLLWVDIVLDNEYGTAAKATIALHYSKQVPISLYIVDATIWWTVESLRETVIVNKNRIRKLLLLDWKPHLVLPMLVQLSPMPLLEHVRCESSWDRGASTSFLENVPTPLKEIENLTFDETLLRRLNISQLRSIHLQTESDPFLDVPENASNLETFFIISNNFSRGLDTHKPSQSYRTPLGWKHLRFVHGETQTVFKVIHRLTHLTYLEISVDGWMLPALFLQLGALVRLTSLRLVLVGDWSDFHVPTTPHISTTVNTLALIMMQYETRLDRDIANLLFLCCPNTTRLVLAASRKSTAQTLLAPSGFMSLKAVLVSLDRHGNPDISLESPVLFVDSLESISYLGPSEAFKLLFQQQVAKVQRLTVELPDADELLLDPLRWPGLHALSVKAFSGIKMKVGWGTGTFRHLSSISVCGGDVLFAPESVTRICRDIALYPDRLPSLGKLRFEMCPELDILLILLVRRNVQSTPGISAITSLEIPTRCPPLLVECFKAIIQGVPVTLPAYYGLSLAGAFEIAQDTAIPGCVDCHRALRYCEGGQGYPALEKAPRPTFEHTKYPEDESEILQTWEARADQWYPFERTPSNFVCSTWFGMVTISR